MLKHYTIFQFKPADEVSYDFTGSMKTEKAEERIDEINQAQALQEVIQTGFTPVPETVLSPTPTENESVEALTSHEPDLKHATMKAEMSGYVNESEGISPFDGAIVTEEKAMESSETNKASLMPVAVGKEEGVRIENYLVFGCELI